MRVKPELRPNDQDPTAWDLWVNGRREITAESFAVVDQVRYGLLGCEGITGECREIAVGILANRPDLLA